MVQTFAFTHHLSFHVWFDICLDWFIWKFYITYSVISPIEAFVLITFKNKIRKIDFKQKRKLLDILKDYIYSKRITIIKYDNFI